MAYSWHESGPSEHHRRRRASSRDARRLEQSPERRRDARRSPAAPGGAVPAGRDRRVVRRLRRAPARRTRRVGQPRGVARRGEVGHEPDLPRWSEVWWCELPDAGRRPAVVLTRDPGDPSDCAASPSHRARRHDPGSRQRGRTGRRATIRCRGTASSTSTRSRTWSRSRRLVQRLGATLRHPDAPGLLGARDPRSTVEVTDPDRRGQPAGVSPGSPVSKGSMLQRENTERLIRQPSGVRRYSSS